MDTGQQAVDAARRAGGTRWHPGRGPRSRQERDAVTVEIAFALASAGVLAGAAFLALASPALFGSGSPGWIQSAQWAGGTLFVARVLWVLLRRPGRQPSQPGRTSPDS